MDNITPQKFISKNLSALSELTKVVYPKGEIANPSYLEWEYFKNPAGEAIINCAFDGGKAVSQYIIIPKEYYCDGQLLHGSLSLNTLTHPDYRGKGLFTNLAEETYKEAKRTKLKFTIGFPNKSSFPGFKNKLGFSVVQNIPLLIKPVHPSKASIKFIFNNESKSGRDINLVIPVNDYITLFNNPEDKDMYELFISKIHQRDYCIGNRNIENMKWRYLDIPLRKYYLFKEVRKNKMTGFLILRAKKIFGLRCGIIMDFITTENSKSDDGLSFFIKKIAKANDLDLLFTTLPAGTPEYSQLKNAGFFRVPVAILPQKLPMIIRYHSDIQDIKKWFITFGDYDIF